MKDAEREKTTAELAIWQMKQMKEAELTGQSRNQNKLKTSKEKQENGYWNGGKFKLGKFK